MNPGHEIEIGDRGEELEEKYITLLSILYSISDYDSVDN